MAFIFEEDIASEHIGLCVYTYIMNFLAENMFISLVVEKGKDLQL